MSPMALMAHLAQMAELKQNSLEFVLLYHITQHNAQLGRNVRLQCGLISLDISDFFQQHVQLLVATPFFQVPPSPISND